MFLILLLVSMVYTFLVNRSILHFQYYEVSRIHHMQNMYINETGSAICGIGCQGPALEKK